MSKLIVILACLIGTAAFAQGTCPSGVPSGVTNCWFVSSSGSDTNTGTTESAPWAHAPGMPTCTGNCASTSPGAGDGFIFEGGDSWDNSNFTWTIGGSGTSANPLYFGVDKTWYSGASWTRPSFTVSPQGNGGNQGIILLDKTHVTIDGFELKHLVTASSSFRALVYIECSSYILVENSFLHDWNTTATADDAYGALFNNNYSGCTGDGDIASHDIISNSEWTGIHPSGVAVREWDVEYSVIHDVSSAQLFGRSHDSLYYNVSYPSTNDSFDATYHMNTIYLQHGGDGGTYSDNTMWVYNDVIYDVSQGETSGAIYDDNCSTSYIFNNVIWGVYNDYAINIDPELGSGSCGTYYIWNNTVEVPAANATPSPIGVTYRSYVKADTVTVQNNHGISSSPYLVAGSGNVVTLTQTNNLLQTSSTATADGYASSQTYAFSPTSGSSPTVGVGTNLTSSWPTGPFDGETPSANDTTYACTYTESTETINCPKRMSQMRPSSGRWDVGAYEFGSSTSSAPQPPAGLIATVN